MRFTFIVSFFAALVAANADAKANAKADFDPEDVHLNFVPRNPHGA